MLVEKRDRTTSPFSKEKIVKAIESCMRETKIGVNTPLAEEIASRIEESFKNTFIVHVEAIQDKVEDFLMESGAHEYARTYIKFRNTKAAARGQKVGNKGILSDEFISKYKHLGNPMGQLGSFVYYRTYSRFLPEEKRREYWWETVKRAVNYNTSLAPTSKEEAEQLFDNIFHLRQFLSGRTFWVGNTPSSFTYPMSNYNCAAQIIDNFEAFGELFYLLMLGSGVGLRILKSDVQKLPKVRGNYTVIHENYMPREKGDRLDNTALSFQHDTIAKITVGDSKEGWMQALRYFFDIIYRSEYKKIEDIIINYDNVRPKGERLVKFGGTASGHESLKTMFYKIDKVIKDRTLGKRVNLKPIDCLDIANIIGENVVSGGVRRSSEIILMDADDEECIDAKSNLYKQVDGQWLVDKDIVHRQMSNNSIYYLEKPTREKLHWQIEKMRYSGEPAWINGEAGAKRRPNMNGANPCGEILLDDKGMCNLTTLNTLSFVKDGILDKEALLHAQRLSARAGYRMTCVEMELHKWNEVLQRDKLVGCSMTGWQDMINATKMSREEEKELLQELRQVAHEAAKEIAAELGGNEPLLVTTVKPEGTLSQLPTVSSGVHYSHSSYFIRRVRISANDPLLKVCEELGYPIFPEVGQDPLTCVTKVVEFPVKAPEGRTKYDISAIEQLENYKLFMENYVDHNCSITVHVRADEWEAVEQWVWDNWDSQIGLSFLSLDDSFYQLMPYEAITKEEYEARVAAMSPFIPSLISKYEILQEEVDVKDADCATGLCPVR